MKRGKEKKHGLRCAIADLLIDCCCTPTPSSLPSFSDCRLRYRLLLLLLSSSSSRVEGEILPVRGARGVKSMW